MKKIIIFGAGEGLFILEREGYLDNVEVLAVCDNDTQKHGKHYKTYEIISPDKIAEYEYEEIWISSNRYYSVMRKQLVEDLNIEEEKIKEFISKRKQEAELSFWKSVYEKNAKGFNNAPNTYYKKLMLGMAEEETDEFWRGKIVADFGCGPRGSLAWTNTPKIKIGIDVLSEKYLREFGDELISHNMLYVTSTEDRIPIPDNFVDFLITMNSLDHVTKLDNIISELLRILKPEGILLASFNLNEPFARCEPQTLTEKKLEDKLLKYFDTISYRLVYQVEEHLRYHDFYNNFFEDNVVKSLDDDKEGILWFKGKKKY